MGSISGIDYMLEIVATDGLLGWFIQSDGTPWMGHIQCFDGDVKPLYSYHAPSNGKVKKPKSLRKKSRRQIILETL